MVNVLFPTEDFYTSIPAVLYDFSLENLKYLACKWLQFYKHVFCLYSIYQYTLSSIPQHALFMFKLLMF